MDAFIAQRIHHQSSGSVDIDILSPTSSNNPDSLTTGYRDFNAPPPGSPAINDVSFAPSFAAQAGSYHGSPYGSDLSFSGADDFGLDTNQQQNDIIDFGPAGLSINDDYDPAAYDAPSDAPFFNNDFMASLTESATAHPAFSPHSSYSKFGTPPPALGHTMNISQTGASSPSMSQKSSTSSNGHQHLHQQQQQHPHVSVTPAPDPSPRMGTRGMGFDGAYGSSYDQGTNDAMANIQGRSRASSVSSAHNGQHQQTATSIAQSWPYVSAPGQLPQSPPPSSGGGAKPQSPPQLSISTPDIATGSPSPTHSTHSNRSERLHGRNNSNGNIGGGNVGGGGGIGASAGTSGSLLAPGGPGINIEPATPVSGGGVGVQSVPFQQTLGTLGGQPNPTSSAGAPPQASIAQPSPFAPQHQRSLSSPQPRIPDAPPSPYNFTPGLSPSPGPPGSTGTSVNGDDILGGGDGGYGRAAHHMRSTSQGLGASSPFLSPAASPALSAHGLELAQQQESDFLLPMNQNPRSRSKSDTSLTPPNWSVQGQQQQHQQHQQQGGDGSGGYGAGTVHMNDVMGYGGGPSQQQHVSPHGSPIPSHPQLLNHVSYGPPTSNAPTQSSYNFLSPNISFGGLAPSSVDLRRAKSDGGMGHRRGARSEDITASMRRELEPNSLFPPGSGGQYLTPGSGDSLGLGFGGSLGLGGVGPSGVGAHRRTASGGGSHGRSLSRERLSHSHGTSPYPSPHASPRNLPSDLPPLGMGMGMDSLNMGMGGTYGMTVPSNVGPGVMGMGNVPVHVMSVGADGLPTVQSQQPITVPRQNVTTNATADASQRRRRTEATFTCPVPGCGSTFTRHFNLKGHLRSHNEERPFKCKWPGCDKGFARQHDCKRHEQLHLNIRPYICHGCQRTFARMDALNRHLRSDAGAECQARQPLLTTDQPNNPNARGGSSGSDNDAMNAEQQDVKPSWNGNGVTL